MTRIQSIHWKEFEKFLSKIGCVFTREKGDHRVYWKKGLKRPVVIPRDTSLPAFIGVRCSNLSSVYREDEDTRCALYGRWPYLFQKNSHGILCPILAVSYENRTQNLFYYFQ